MPVFEGKAAITSFAFSVASMAILTAYQLPLWMVVITEGTYILSLLVIMYSLHIVKIVFCSHVLGTVFASGFIIMLSGEDYGYFGFYAMALAFFHFSEYIVTSIFNPHTLSIDSFLLNHSLQYVVAAISSWVEYLSEYYFFPQLKSSNYICLVGAVAVVFGESLRKIAMVTGGSNFTHIVQYRKRDGHQLVTSGVYSIFRHPSYVGWFYWSIGTQVLLCNPICLVGYVAASWMFFKDRIEDEEESLILFFGEDYIEYKRKVGTGIPFISGYPMTKAPSLLRYSRIQH